MPLPIDNRHNGVIVPISKPFSLIQCCTVFQVKTMQNTNYGITVVRRKGIAFPRLINTTLMKA
jgi:hypothetical protein